MEFGTFMEFHTRTGNLQKEAFDESFNHAMQAEELGLNTIWLSESHFSPDRSVLSAPLIIASSIASRTKNVKIGTAVQVIPLSNPIRIAEEVATLDHISGGRFEFGVGRSGLPEPMTDTVFHMVKAETDFMSHWKLLSLRLQTIPSHTKANSTALMMSA